MMKSLLLSALYSALRAYLGSGVYNRIAAEVMAQMQYTGLSGAEKMSRVLAFAQREAVMASEYLIRAAVELVLYRAKTEG
jgi:hypothetical protein